MNLTKEVAEFVNQHGTKSLDDIAPHFVNKDRRQVMKALQNAAHLNLIHCVGNLPRPSGSGKGAAIYSPGPKPEVVMARRMNAGRVSSVWELANV